MWHCRCTATLESERIVLILIKHNIQGHYSLECVRWCLIQSWRWVNFLSQTLHVYGFSPVCVRRWFFRVLIAVNRIGQKSQAYGRSPVWMRRCLTRELDVVKADPHWSHMNGWSPEWVRWCESNSPLVTYEPLQVEQWNDLVCECRFMCCRRLVLWENAFPQTVHWNGRSPLWDRICSRSVENWLNPFGQCGHWCFLLSRCSFKWMASKSWLENTSEQTELGNGSSRCCLKCAARLVSWMKTRLQI